MSMKNNMILEYKVIEDNGGGLTLVVFDSNDIIYMHTGYENNPGQLQEDLEQLRNGANPITDGWDGNEADDLEKTDLEYLFSWDQYNVGWKVIADNDGIYPEDMGSAGRIEFDVKEV